MSRHRRPTRAEQAAEAVRFARQMQDHAEDEACFTRLTGITYGWADANWQAWRDGYLVGTAPTQAGALELLEPHEAEAWASWSAAQGEAFFARIAGHR